MTAWDWLFWLSFGLIILAIVVLVWVLHRFGE